MIFPEVQTLEQKEGNYCLKNNYINLSLLDFYRAVKDGNEDVSVSKNVLLAKEEYWLEVNGDGITLTASCDEGIYRGATSLYQLVKKGEVPCIKVWDKPQFERRGYMLDISRCRMPKLKEIKKQIDFLSALKYNEYQLYMEGECFKYKAYPKYTEDFDCLTPEDIEELDAYCSERFIDLVPNQNSLGHMERWLKFDEFSHLALSDGTNPKRTLNPLDEESYEFVTKLYESLLPHFKSKYVNIGLDEAFGLGDYQTAEFTEKYGKNVLFMNWLNKLADHVRENYGKSVMCWSDMIFKSRDIYDMLPKDALVLEWGYEYNSSFRMEEHCSAFEESKLNYYVCPSCNTHKSFTGRADVTWYNIRTSAEIGAKHGAKGLLMTDWGCLEAHPHFGVWSLVPAALAGQYAWNVGKMDNGDSFKADYVHNAEKYVDETVFSGIAVSKQLYRMQTYYLLEPERVHVGTICGELFQFPISQSNYYTVYDIKDFADSFYFDNVTEYVQKVLRDIEKLDIDEQFKREIILNAKMVILSSELCKLRLGETMPNDKLDELISLTDWISEEYYELWCRRNYEKGVEEFMGYLKDRRRELSALK